MKVLDMCVCDENEMVDKIKVKEFFGEFGCISWREYFECLEEGSLDILSFNYEDIDRSVFVIDDGGELIRLKNGCYVNICWRGDCCRIWFECDDEKIEFMNNKLL